MGKGRDKRRKKQRQQNNHARRSEPRSLAEVQAIGVDLASGPDSTVVQVCDVTIDSKLIATQAVAVLNPKL